MQDLVLAIAHHLIVFALFGLVCAEIIALAAPLDAPAIRRVARLDLAYGALAALIVGFVRAIFAAKGWAYYSHNAFFWAKIGTFGIAGLLSIPPTLTFARWRKSTGLPDASAVRAVRTCLHWELMLFLLIPAFAALMARGYGSF